MSAKCCLCKDFSSLAGCQGLGSAFGYTQPWRSMFVGKVAPAGRLAFIGRAIHTALHHRPPGLRPCNPVPRFRLPSPTSSSIA